MKSVEERLDDLIQAKVEFMALKALAADAKQYESGGRSMNRLEQKMMDQRKDDLFRRLDLAERKLRATNKAYNEIIAEECKRKGSDELERLAEVVGDRMSYIGLED